MSWYIDFAAKKARVLSHWDEFWQHANHAPPDGVRSMLVDALAFIGDDCVVMVKSHGHLGDGQSTASLEVRQMHLVPD
jgi:hypothetical protein